MCSQLGDAGSLLKHITSKTNLYETNSKFGLCGLQGQWQRSSFEDPLLRSSAGNAGYGAAGPSAGAVPHAFGGFDLERANSSMGFTLAADLLGMPSLHGEYNAKVRVPCPPFHESAVDTSLVGDAKSCTLLCISKKWI